MGKHEEKQSSEEMETHVHRERKEKDFFFLKGGRKRRSRKMDKLEERIQKYATFPNAHTHTHNHIILPSSCA